MIEVLKHGKRFTTRDFKCPVCNCEFRCTINDCYWEIGIHGYKMYCPECGESIEFGQYEEI